MPGDTPQVHSPFDAANQSGPPRDQPREQALDLRMTAEDRAALRARAQREAERLESQNDGPASRYLAEKPRADSAEHVIATLQSQLAVECNRADIAEAWCDELLKRSHRAEAGWKTAFEQLDTCLDLTQELVEHASPDVQCVRVARGILAWRQQERQKLAQENLDPQQANRRRPHEVTRDEATPRRVARTEEGPAEMSR